MTTDDMTNAWNAKSGSFVKRPGKGWLHSDEKLQHEGVVYNVTYVGLIPVHESMKSLSFEMRTFVARESIRRVAESAHGANTLRRNKQSDDSINRILSSNADLSNGGVEIALHINIQFLKATPIDDDQDLFEHMMQNISFACGGDTDIQNFVAYVAKDEHMGRACYVFECANGLASNVITTIGQAFELRFKKFLNAMPSNNNSSNTNPNSNISAKPQNISNSKTKENLTANMSPPTVVHLPQIHDNPTKKHNHNSIHEHINSKVHQTDNDKVSRQSDDNQINNQIWFHGLLTRENAELLLKMDGDYLVRTSNKTADRQYVLSGRYKGEYRHIFLVDPNGVVRTKDRVFDNICHLIKYHQDNNIPIVSKDNELLLENPIARFS